MSSILRTLMREMDMNEAQFAEHIGVNRSMVCRWLKGVEPSLKAIRAIAERCPIDANELLGIDASESHVRTEPKEVGIDSH